MYAQFRFLFRFRRRDVCTFSVSAETEKNGFGRPLMHFTECHIVSAVVIAEGVFFTLCSLEWMAVIPDLHIPIAIPMQLLLGPFHGAIAVPSVMRCRRWRCRRHRCAGGARLPLATSAEWA